jgi:hypothetical protein
MLGSGIFRCEGWKTLDCNPEHHPDFLATIPPLPEAVKAIQWDEIEWIHGITSLYPWEARDILRELHSVLRPPQALPRCEGGKLVLEQPNFTKARAMREWLFGDPSHREPRIMNRWSYTPEELFEELQAAGFSKIEILPAQHHVPGRDFRVDAWR